MAEVGDITRLALLHCGASPIAQPAEGTYGALALEIYNLVLFEWSSAMNLLDGTGAPYVHATQGVGATFPLGDDKAAGVAAFVALRLAPILGLEENITPQTRSQASVGYGQVLGAYQKTTVQDQGILARYRYYE